MKGRDRPWGRLAHRATRCVEEFRRNQHPGDRLVRGMLYLVLLLFLVLSLLAPAAAESKVRPPGYGYVGPTCAVVDGSLYLHGVPKRRLNSEEVNMFQMYQEDVSKFRENVLSHQFISMDSPAVPSFCLGFDDSVEVILDKCIVRSNHVYIAEKLIRPLSNRERHRLDTALTRRSMDTSERNKRQTKSEPGTTPQRDISSIFHRFLNVNSTVTSRFLPVVSRSPLFSMDGALQSVLGAVPAVEKALHSTSSPQRILPTTYQPPVSRATFKPLFPQKKEITKKRSMYTVAPLPETTQRPTTTPTTTTRTHSTTASAPRSLSMKPIYAAKKTLRRKPYATARSTTTAASVSVPSQGEGETVSDPLILQLIAKALENNQLLDTVLAPGTTPPRASVSFHGSVRPKVPFPTLNLRFVPPSAPARASWYAPTEPGPSPNVPFAPHMAYTTFAGNDSIDRTTKKVSPEETPLPDEICTAHLQNNPLARY